MAKRTKKKEEVTVSALKSWLDGIMEFQAADWVPDKSQWKTVVEKIQSLKEVEPVPQPQPKQNAPQTGAPPSRTWDGDDHHAAPAAPQPRVPMTMRAGSGGVMGSDQPVPVNVGDRVKTPNIDTSTEEYKSGFR